MLHIAEQVVVSQTPMNVLYESSQVHLHRPWQLQRQKATTAIADPCPIALAPNQQPRVSRDFDICFSPAPLRPTENSLTNSPSF